MYITFQNKMQITSFFKVSGKQNKNELIDMLNAFFYLKNKFSTSIFSKCFTLINDKYNAIKQTGHSSFI